MGDIYALTPWSVRPWLRLAAPVLTRFLISYNGRSRSTLTWRSEYLVPVTCHSWSRSSKWEDDFALVVKSVTPALCQRTTSITVLIDADARIQDREAFTEMCRFPIRRCNPVPSYTHPSTETRKAQHWRNVCPWLRDWFGFRNNLSPQLSKRGPWIAGR